MLANVNSSLIFAPTIRAISSAGSEHLVYTEGVGGSNPSSPTLIETSKINDFGGFFMCFQLKNAPLLITTREHLSLLYIFFN